MPIKGGITLGDRLELIVEVNHNLAQWHIVQDFHTITRDILLFHQFTTFAQAQSHDWTNKIAGRNHARADIRFLNAIYHSNIWHTRRIVHLYLLAVLGIDIITYVRHGGYHIHIKLTIQTLLHNLHMKQTQESAAETKAQCHRRLRRESQSGIIQLKFLQRCTQVLIILRLNRIHTRKDHRFSLLKSCNRFCTWTSHVRNGITYFHLGRSLDTRNDISHITCRNLFGRLHIQFQHTYLVRIVFLTRIEETHTVIRFHRTIDHLEIGDNSAERVEHRIKHQALQWRLRVSLWRSNTVNNRIQYLWYTITCLSRTTQYLLTFTTQQIDDLILHFLGHSRVHIALIHHRDNLQVMLKSHIEVGDRLRLHTLRCIYDQ